MGNMTQDAAPTADEQLDSASLHSTFSGSLGRHLYGRVSLNRRIAIVGVVMLIFWLAQALFFDRIIRAGPLNSVPVLLAALLLGVRGTVVVGLVHPLCGAVLLYFVGPGGWGAKMLGTAPFIVALTVVALIIAKVRDLSVVLRQEIDRRKLAEEHSRALTRFIVHDLKGSLGVVKSNAHYLADALQADHPDLEEAESAVSDIAGASQMLERMVQNALTTQWSDHGLEPELEALDLATVVRDVQQRMGRLASQRQRKLVQTGTAAPVPAWADGELVRRVLENLVDNALRHTPANTPVSIEARNDEDSAALLFVRDEGDGIPPADRQKVFSGEVQPQSGVRSRQNFGLGLRFCQLAVAAHGGQIWVEANDPRGSVFCVRLPAGPQ
jgi:signal transduction histidine kinase